MKKNSTSDTCLVMIKSDTKQFCRYI